LLRRRLANTSTTVTTATRNSHHDLALVHRGFVVLSCVIFFSLSVFVDD
jgi:hypothetical protein